MHDGFTGREAMCTCTNKPNYGGPTHHHQYSRHLLLFPLSFIPTSASIYQLPDSSVHWSRRYSVHCPSIYVPSCQDLLQCPSPLHEPRRSPSIQSSTPIAPIHATSIPSHFLAFDCFSSYLIESVLGPLTQIPTTAIAISVG